MRRVITKQVKGAEGFQDWPGKNVQGIVRNGRVVIISPIYSNAIKKAVNHFHTTTFVNIFVRNHLQPLLKRVMDEEANI